MKLLIIFLQKKLSKTQQTKKGICMKEKSKIEKLKEVVIDRLIENNLTDIELQINVLLLKIILDNEFK